MLTKEQFRNRLDENNDGVLCCMHCGYTAPQCECEYVDEAEQVATPEPPPHSGDKYIRKIYPRDPDSGEQPINVDVYSVVKAFDVKAGPRDHAVKKLLCAGLRGKGDERQDISEAIDALKRDLQQLREGE